MAAEFEATVSIELSYVVETDTYTVLGNEVVTYNAVVSGSIDGTFTVGDTITINGSFSVEFVGHVSGGIVVQRDGDFFLYANAEKLVGSTFQVSVTPFPVCFLEGTRIATPDGLRAVETLSIGDLVTTADGTTRPVRWIGRQTIVALFADPLHAYPIRIAPGALGDGLPVRDLFVSPDHALLVDGLLVQASALVNGTTITRAPAPAPRFTYFHVELVDHALILAEGVPAETFVDHVTRRRFDNFAEFEALYGAEQANIAELAMPRIKSARQLPRATRERLDAHGAASKVAAAA
ncbi:Hint domain-containing protein [Pseudoxanthobacter sp. M-2]|uniref:Hint domain-containing protein n=1 Tax=Pseudoxanthobacter sp. M-2 TaxID=3078754 RepID=UPI0038FC2BFA